ncbi:MAG: hypothetical protein A49_26590 [Methyloceanibacter sp.]|nr:MAG: hypothetical protein A49_26590 [Methyloceanibacter sp.]
MRQWLRKVRLSFPGGFVINPAGIVVPKGELKVGFNVSKGISGSANTAAITIWNLNEGHRNAVGKELDSVQLEAGYMPPEGGGNVGVLFKGSIRDVKHTRDGTDIITEINCGDGDAAFRSATISKTYPAGTPVPEVVEGIYKELEKKGLARGEWKFPDQLEDFKRPYSMCGACTREMDTLGRGKGFYWSSQNETVEVIPADGHLPGVVLISPQTGMIDVPAITDNGVQVSALLNPEVRPNRTVQIESQVLEMNGEGGLYRVSQATYSGDNWDGDFRVSIHGEAIKGGKVDEGQRPK